jgi:hypothetical protein
LNPPKEENFQELFFGEFIIEIPPNPGIPEYIIKQKAYSKSSEIIHFLLNDDKKVKKAIILKRNL